jgi:hypothetical protein
MRDDIRMPKPIKENFETSAEGVNDPDAKEQLLKLADDYEKLASGRGKNSQTGNS